MESGLALALLQEMDLQVPADLLRKDRSPWPYPAGPLDRYPAAGAYELSGPGHDASVRPCSDPAGTGDSWAMSVSPWMPGLLLLSPQCGLDL